MTLDRERIRRVVTGAAKYALVGTVLLGLLGLTFGDRIMIRKYGIGAWPVIAINGFGTLCLAFVCAALGGPHTRTLGRIGISALGAVPACAAFLLVAHPPLLFGSALVTMAVYALGAGVGAVFVYGDFLFDASPDDAAKVRPPRR